MSWLTGIAIIVAAFCLIGLANELICDWRSRRDLDRRISRKDGGL